MLPRIVDSFDVQAQIVKGTLAGIEVKSILGDQQSSAYAHELKKHQMKITYGTGCFMLANIGQEAIIHPSFITTILFKHKGQIEYAFEGAV
jgi:glycerol kinase